MKSAVIAICASVLLGTAWAQSIYRQEDSFSGNTRFYTAEKSVELEGGSFFSRRYVTLSLHISKLSANQEKPYSIQITADTPSWVFISRGESLLLKINEAEPTAVRGDGSLSYRRVNRSDSVTEIARYAVSADLLQKISEAKVVDFRVLGDQQVITGKLSSEFLLDAKAMLQNSASLSLTNKDSTSKESGSPKPRRLGVSFVPITNEMRAAFNSVDLQGVVVVVVEPGSVAQASGLQVGDVILTMNGSVIASIKDVQDGVQSSPKEGQIEVQRAATKLNLKIAFAN